MPNFFSFLGAAISLPITAIPVTGTKRPAYKLTQSQQLSWSALAFCRAAPPKISSEGAKIKIPGWVYLQGKKLRPKSRSNRPLTHQRQQPINIIFEDRTYIFKNSNERFKINLYQHKTRPAIRRNYDANPEILRLCYKFKRPHKSALSLLFFVLRLI